MSDRYDAVRAALPDVLPPTTKEEARRAAQRIQRHFRTDDSKRMYGRLLPRGIRMHRDWVGEYGWLNIIHDMSHRIFGYHYPHKRPHDPLHAHYETEVAKYVVASGWLDGTLKPKVKPPKPKPTADEIRAADIAKLEAAIKRWTTKAKRANTAIVRLNRKLNRIRRLVM
jgi:hypothetical protein